MFMPKALILMGLAIILLAGCSPKEPVSSDPWAESQFEEAFAAEADTLTYDFLAEAEPLEESAVPAEADLPDLLVEEPLAVDRTEADEATPVLTEAQDRPPIEEGPLFWVQIFASGNRQSAEEFALEADGRLSERVRILYLEPNYKVLVGGYADRDEAVDLRHELVSMGYEGAWIFEK